MSRWGTDHDPVGFWTILFAVAGGVLLADLVKALLAAVLAGAVLSSLTTSVKPQSPTPGHLPARPDLIVSEPKSPPRPSEILFGPVQALDSGISRACIDGFAVNRNGAGWAREMPPVGCVPNSD